MACFVRWRRVCSPNARCWRRPVRKAASIARKVHLPIWRDSARHAGRRGNAEVRFFRRRRWRFAARLTGPLSSCGCPRSNFELLSITACLGDYLNSISVVENYMEHSIISEPGLLISDNASGISGMTPLSDAIERMSSTIRYRTVFSPYGRDMLRRKKAIKMPQLAPGRQFQSWGSAGPAGAELNAVKVNARVSYFPPPAFRESFRVFGPDSTIPESV